MGKFTRQDDLRIDQVIQSHMEFIRDCTLQFIRPQAILLAGSFGRGEGSAYLEGDKVKFASDYEICMISNLPWARLQVDRITRELQKKIPVNVSFFWNSPARIWNNRSRNLSFGRPQQTIAMYELKAGSQIVYGDFDLKKNSYGPTEIPVTEGIRLIANRMMEVIETCFNKSINGSIYFPLAKLILACGDSLLLRDGLYHYSYTERAARFGRAYVENYQPIFGSELLKHYMIASHYKLKPGSVTPNLAKDELPFSKQISQEVIRFLMNKGGAPLTEVVQQCALSIPLYYETGIIPFWDRQYENLILGIRARRAHHPINWRMFPKSKPRLSPFQALYAAIPGLYWGLPLIDSGNEEMIDLASKWGSWAVRKGTEVNADSLTKSLIDMWHILG